MMNRLLVALAMAACALVPVACSSAPGTATAKSCQLPVFGPGASYHPSIDPASFTSSVTNQWLPLRPGDTFVSTGVKDDAKALDVVQVSSSTRVIDGVTTRVVNDRLFLDGSLEETTSDYFAQDACGNVWYFGEDTATLDDSGHMTDRSGTFHAGVGGAEPGVFMQANPEPGRLFRQEWSPGNAEDVYKVLSVNGYIMRTEETTALEPGVVDGKEYVRGTGTVREATLKGGNESLRLVSVLR